MKPSRRKPPPDPTPRRRKPPPEPIPTKRKLPPLIIKKGSTCAACKGTGKSSKGYDCYPCNGRGVIQR